MATFLLMVHNTGNTEDSYSATIIGTNGPVTATLVGLDGSPTQSISTFILPGLSTGAIELQVSLAQLGQGMVTVQVQSLTNPAITARPVASVVTIAPTNGGTGTGTTGSGTGTTGAGGVTTGTGTGITDGPEVIKVLRYGYHWMPTTLVLTFNQALDPSTADDSNDYRIIGPEGKIIRVQSAVYDASTDSVTLHPSQRIDIHYQYELIVDGTTAGGITSTSGLLLDGTDSGKPGSDYRGPLTWCNLVLDPPTTKIVRRTKTVAPHVKVKSQPAVHAISHKAAPFNRPRAFRR